MSQTSSVLFQKAKEAAERNVTQLKPKIKLKLTVQSPVAEPLLPTPPPTQTTHPVPAPVSSPVPAPVPAPAKVSKPQGPIVLKAQVHPQLQIQPQPPPMIVHEVEQTEWAEKYRPKDLDTLVGNRAQIAQIRDWFTKFRKRDPNIKKAILFSGCPGTSKTTVAHVVLKEFGYDVKEYNASDVRSKKLVEENLEKLITTEQVDKHFRPNFRPFGIIMDEVDGMSSGDKGGMSQLIKTINPNRGKRCVKKSEKQKTAERWIPPIICICNTGYDKKISDLRKDCFEVKFEKPTVWDLCQVIRNVTKQEHIIMTESAEKVVAELAQGDFRRLIFLLKNFSNIEKRPIETNDIYAYYDVISKKIIDLSSFDVTNKIFQSQTRVEEILKLYDTDKSLLPMMVHENYVTVVNAQNTNNANKMRNCYQCIDAIVNGDVIEKIMYNTQSWSLQPIHGLTSCYIPSYYANVHPLLGYRGASWTTALGRYSLRCANIKNINLLSSMLNTGHTYSVEDIQLLSQVILYNLLDPHGDRKIGAEYMKQYNLSVKDIEKLIKVDKLSDKYKKLYTSRQKTQLRNMFGHLEHKTIHSTTYNMSKTVPKVEKSCSTSTSTSTKKKTTRKAGEDDADDDDGEDTSSEGAIVCGDGDCLDATNKDEDEDEDDEESDTDGDGVILDEI